MTVLTTSWQQERVEQGLPTLSGSLRVRGSQNCAHMLRDGLLDNPLQASHLGSELKATTAKGEDKICKAEKEGSWY